MAWPTSWPLPRRRVAVRSPCTTVVPLRTKERSGLKCPVTFPNLLNDPTTVVPYPPNGDAAWATAVRDRVGDCAAVDDGTAIATTHAAAAAGDTTRVNRFRAAGDIQGCPSSARSSRPDERDRQRVTTGLGPRLCRPSHIATTAAMPAVFALPGLHARIARPGEVLRWRRRGRWRGREGHPVDMPDARSSARRARTGRPAFPARGRRCRRGAGH